MKLWLISSTGDEILNADFVSNIYQKDGSVRASLCRPGQAPLDVELKVDSLNTVRNIIQLADQVVV